MGETQELTPHPRRNPESGRGCFEHGLHDQPEFSEVVISAEMPRPGDVLVAGTVTQPVSAIPVHPGSSSVPAPPPTQPLVSSKPSLPYFDVTATRHGVQHFVGRTSLISELHETISSLRGATRTVVLQGLGGQGKTAVAIQYARVYHDATYKLVLWMDATSEQTMGSACRRIIRDRGLIQEVEVVTDTQAVDKVASYLQNPEAECLVLFDNFDTTNPLEQNRITAVLPLGLQPRERVTIIITSRNYGTDAYGSALRIEGMKEADAYELLLYRWAPTRPVSDQQMGACKKILEGVGYHPLAIGQAGAYLHKMRMDPREFLQMINSSRDTTMDFVPDNFSYKKLYLLVADNGVTGPTAEEIYLNAFRTWDISMGALGGGDWRTRPGTSLNDFSVSAKVLRLSAFLSREHLPSTLFNILGETDHISPFLQWLRIPCSNNAGQWDRRKFKRFVSEPVNLFLMGMQLAEDGLEFELTTHPLVQEWAILGQPAEHTAFFFEAAIELLKSHMRPDNFDLEPESRDMILNQLDSITRNDDLLYRHDPPLNLPICLGRGYLIPVTMKFASFYLDYGLHKQTHSLYTRIIERNPHPSGNRQLHIILQATEGLAIVELLQGKFYHAEKHCREALRGYEALPEKYEGSRLRALHNLGEICGAQRKFSEILDLFRRSLEGSRRIYGNDHILTLREVEAYGNAHRLLKKYDDAAVLYVEAIDGMKKVFKSEDHPDLLGALEGLAIVRKGQQKYSEAETLYRVALKGDIEHLGKNHPDTINVVEGLADVYAAQQDSEVAIRMYQEAGAAREMIVGAQHPDTLRLLRKIDNLSNSTAKSDFIHDTAVYPWYRAIDSGDDNGGEVTEESDEARRYLEEQQSVLQAAHPELATKQPREATHNKSQPKASSEGSNMPELEVIPVVDPRSPDSVPHNTPLLLFDEREQPATSCSREMKLADEFLENFEAFLVQHQSYWGREPRIRVAVLDTGIDENEIITRTYIHKIREERRTSTSPRDDNPIKAVKSFVGDKGGDTCGHGTRVVQLMLRLAPQADLYVAKVSKGLRDGNSKSAEFVAQALDWAVGENVDIITMSFGLAEWDNRVSEALGHAAASSILIAAAANWGYNRARPFPANDTRVICIHACDGNGYDSGGMNPSIEGQHDSWTTLGLDIKFYWAGESVCKSGASYATPIAAAMVVNAMDYVNCLAAERKLTEARTAFLHSREGVRHILRLMSSANGQFRYVTPWNLWDGPWSSTQGRDENYVCERLASNKA